MSGERENKVVDVILHCQKQLKKERLPEEKLLHYLGRLARLRITVPDLAETGIGRTVNSLSRNDSPVGQAAETLVRGWKQMVSEQQSQAEAQPESEEEEESDSNSGSSEEDEEELKIDIKEPSNQVENQVEPYHNGHVNDIGPSENSSNRNADFVEEDEDNDDIDDPYMDSGFLNIANVHTDEEDEEEEEDNENDDSDSDASDRLRIADEEQRRSVELKPNPYIKQEPSYDKLEPTYIKQEPTYIKQEPTYIKQEPAYIKRETESPTLNSAPVEKGNEHKSSSAKNSHNQSSTNSKSHAHHERSRSKSHSSSSKESSKEHKHHKEGKEHRSSKHSNHSLENKNRHHHSSKSHHEKDKTSSKDKQRSNKDSSSHRESKPEKERSKDKKDSTNQSFSSSSNSSTHLQSKEKTREMPTLKSSSPERKKSELHEERKRKEPSDGGSSSLSKKSKLIIKEEIDSTSGVNFSDVLGLLDVPSSSPVKSLKIKKEEVEKSPDKHKHESRKKKHENASSSASSSKHSRERERESSSSSRKAERDSEKLSKKPAHIKLESVAKPVVNISPNYKPMNPPLPSLPRPSTSNGIGGSSTLLSHADLSDLGHIDYYDNPKGDTAMSQEDAISTMLSNRNARSKVFSGVKSTRMGAVPSLFDLCMQVIKDNIGDLGFTGGIPYDILKPALERANPQQLMNIEAQNDHLIGETDELWQFHCRRDFRGICPRETESWRDLYERCKEGQQLKLEQIKKKFKLDTMKRETAAPVRKTKLAFVEPAAGGTRYSKEKAQTIKNGMKSLKIKEEKGVSRSSSASSGFNNPKVTVTGDVTNVIIAPGSRSGSAPAPSVSRESRESTAKLKPKRAPLMQKTMKLIRSLNRR